MVVHLLLVAASLASFKELTPDAVDKHIIDQTYVKGLLGFLVQITSDDDMRHHAEPHEAFEAMAKLWKNISFVRTTLEARSRVANDIGAEHDMLPAYGLWLRGRRGAVAHNVDGNEPTAEDLSNFLRAQIGLKDEL